MNAKKKGKIFVIVFACVIVFIAVALLVSNTFHATNREIDTEDYSASTSRYNGENYIDLNENDLFEVEEEVSSDSIFVLEEYFYTNTEAISVTNNSDSCIDVYLFQKGNSDEAIQQFTLDGRSCKSFSNLTSRFLYQVGVGVKTDSKICLTVSK